MTLKRIALLLALTLVLTGAVGVLVQRAGTGDDRARVVAPADPPAAEPRLRTVREAILPRTVIGDYLGRYGMTPAETDALLKAVRPVYDLAMIRAGHFLDFQLADGGRLEGFRYDIGADSYLQVDRTPVGWTAARKPHPYEFREHCAAGVITDHLFGAVTDLGEEPQLAVALAELFAWDVDFYADLREGDSFRILFQKRFLSGQPAGYGPILAAEFVNQGQAFRAFRYVHADGKVEYYTPAGESVRKSCSSRRSRWGGSPPVFVSPPPPHAQDLPSPPGHRHRGARGHAGSRGGGRHRHLRGYRGQAGRMVEIRHAHRFTPSISTCRYATGIRPGARIRQGQVVGYVGSSGAIHRPAPRLPDQAEQRLRQSSQNPVPASRAAASRPTAGIPAAGGRVRPRVGRGWGTPAVLPGATVADGR